MGRLSDRQIKNLNGKYISTSGGKVTGDLEIDGKLKINGMEILVIESFDPETGTLKIKTAGQSA